jgi:hypothetical protein
VQASHGDERVRGYFETAQQRDPYASVQTRNLLLGFLALTPLSLFVRHSQTLFVFYAQAVHMNEI